jgi:hypothetical protein
MIHTAERWRSMARGPGAYHHHPRCPRVHCIAWFRASHPFGRANHCTTGNATGATGRHAIAARPPLEAAQPIDEGDDGFTSGGTISTGGFRRLDAASALSAPQSRLAIRPLAAKRSPATISIFIESKVEAARWRKRTAGFLRRGRERSERWRSMARGPGAYHHQPRCPRVHCIAWFRASHPFGRANHFTTGNATEATGRHAIAARPPLEAAQPIDEGDDGFTSGGLSARAASGALTLLRPSRPLRAGSPSRPSPHNAAPPPSLSFRRAELRPPDGGRERLASLVGAENARNGGNQRLATFREPHRPILSRVRCIALFCHT